MGKYLLSVDNGLTSTKAVLFALEGREVASGHIGTVIESKGDFAEIDMELQWENTAKAIRECLGKAKVSSADIIGVGNSGHGAGLYCLDRYGRPVRKAVSSMDTRAGCIIDSWNREGRTPRARIHQNFWSGQAVPILNWLKQSEPENYENTQTVLMVKDWIRYRLTGELGIEYTDASNSGIINPRDKRVDKELFRIFDIEEAFHKVPKLYRTTDIAGYVSKTAEEETGLAAGTPVIGGVFDCIACALGSGVYDNEKYSIIAGTWNINSGIEEQLIAPGETVKASLYVDINKYFYSESSATSAVNLSWFMDNVIRGFKLFDVPDEELFRMIEEKLGLMDPRGSDILYMPFLFKSHLSQMNGAFFGLKPEHNIFHMLRALYEGVVFAHRKHIDNLRSYGVDRRSAILSGGAANSSLWSQMFADILDMEIMTVDTTEAGALGSAVCTAAALGIYKDIKEAIAAMVKVKKCYSPNALVKEVYDAKYAAFNTLIKKFD